MKGSCLCGDIEYEIDSIDMTVAHCHCRTCQKAHAAPFASTAGVMREHFRWLKGEDKLSAFESSPGKLLFLFRMRLSFGGRAGESAACYCSDRNAG